MQRRCTASRVFTVVPRTAILVTPSSATENTTMFKPAAVLATLAILTATSATAQEPAKPPASAYDATLASALGGNDKGMREYVLVVLKSGPNKVADAAARSKMFEGHFANMQRLAAAKKLAFAGPLDGVDGWRGIFVIAGGDIDEAKKMVATDPVIVNGEMVAEYHKLYGSAGLMMVNEIHGRIEKK
jgi:uncharacterized protein YciI